MLLNLVKWEKKSKFQNEIEEAIRERVFAGEELEGLLLNVACLKFLFVNENFTFKWMWVEILARTPKIFFKNIFTKI
jgi:hypothetical protein